MAGALIDSHCHLDFECFEADRDQVWSRCRQLGLTRLLMPGTDPLQWQRARRLCEAQPDWAYAAGVHPWWQAGLDGQPWQDDWHRALDHPRCVAVGECGLDRFTDVPLADQQACLVVHLEEAIRRRLPVIIHCVRAHNELIRCLKQYHLPAGGVVHAFSGSAEQALTYWQMGFRLGVGGVITYERARKTRAAVAAVPLAALLLETDAPDMPLCGHQGQRNSPEYLPEVARTLAQLRECSPAQITDATTDNARTLFGL